MALTLLFAGALLLPEGALGETAPGKAEGPSAYVTRFAADVDPGDPLPEYPRPGLVRERWRSLNGVWDYAIRAVEDPAPAAYDGPIVVPFPVESPLSRVARRLAPYQVLEYRRRFSIPPDWRGQCIRLNFETVDWRASVRVNGQLIGEHRGGYDPFSFDITDALSSSGEQELSVTVTDPSDTGPQARGKQVLSPGSIFYTPCSGIWGTVWLEPVPESYIAAYQAVPDVAGQSVALRVDVAGRADGATVQARILDGGRIVGELELAPCAAASCPVPAPKLWSPEAPQLYTLELTLRRDGRAVDSARGYFGMRDVRLGQDALGRPCIMLNGEPVFLDGVLDQGYWPDGIYTAPTDAALKSDIEAVKALGFNMLRKHAKVEPRRFYFHCDTLGVWVFQDMPPGWPRALPRIEARRTAAEAAQFEGELELMVTGLANHPCIMAWVPFNEGWGQYDTQRIAERVKQLDPSRLVDSASGWVDYGVGDFMDIHNYPEPKAPALEAQRALLLGEFGGLGLPIPGHMWADKDWGYAVLKSPQELADRYAEYYGEVRRLARDAGLCGAVYTQLTDVETEANGLLTYDHSVFKVDAALIRAAMR